ncbi:MAG: pilus assembly PilX N-terminal domain-containing protein [Desulfocapsaceae bacterium]|nr:pilus assembly PilX N-terminal domain-containing protein [Desulfocapsaceae bacterium]
MESFRRNIFFKQDRSGEDGFVLVFALVMLVVVTMLGLWSLNTSIHENWSAGNEQAYEQQFNIAEGGIHVEGAKIGSALVSWYALPDPDTPDQLLVPPLQTPLYDPHGSLSPADYPHSIADILPGDAARWPRGNLLGESAPEASEMEYAYLVTYLGADQKNTKGYGAESLTGYAFRINSHCETDIEVGARKIGIRRSSF